MNGQAPTYTKGFWVGLAVATPILGYGVTGALTQLPGVQLTSFLRYVVGAAVINDVVVAPAVGVLAWLVVRRVPAVAVGPVQAALLVSGVVGLVAWPFVRGYGVTEGEPSFLSRDYAASVLTVWAVIWGLAAAVVVVRLLNARRR